MDILAIKRGNKGLVERSYDPMGHIVAAMLDFLQFLQARLHLSGVLEYVVQKPGALSEILRHL